MSNVVVKCGLCLYAAGLLSYALYRALHSSHFRVCGQVNTILFPDVGKSTLIWVVNACTHEEITRVARSNVLALPTSQFGFKTNVRVCDK